MANNSWKQYGGIYKTDKLHNVGIGTLVADSVLLRQKNLTQFTVQGTINVSQDAIIQGQLNLSGNANVSRDLYVSQNSYLAKKLYFGTTTPDPASTYSYIFGNSQSSTGTFGINTITPSTVLDINGTVQNVLAVRTSASTIRNILAQNSSSNGVTSQADNASASIGFFYGNVATATNPNSSISATSGNTITVSSNTAIINSSATSTINSLGGNTVIYSTGSTNMTSKVVASNSGVYNNILGELMTIYDTSNSVFLYDNYENSSAYTGTALTLVARDNSSNTLMSIVAPNKGGLSIGGGTYAYDNTRTMGLLGTTSVAGTFIPSQLIVSGNNLVKYRTTTGINTYGPKTENYVMDINGPTRIGNGEITTVLHVGFEILSMRIAKRYPSVAFIVGTPSARSTPYTATFAYTTNSGQSWTTSNILTTTTGGLYNTANNYCVHVYNQNYAYIGTRTNFLYFTTNGGISWTQVVDAASGIIKRFSTIYVCNSTTAAANRFVFGGYLTNNQDAIIKSQLYYYDTGNLNLMPFGTSSIGYSVIDISLSTVTDSDGSGNFMYLVGNGIIKVDLSGAIPVQKYYINSGVTYNSVFCYDTSYAIVVGQNTISYTTDSLTWSNASVTGINGGTFNMRSVYIYDVLNAVAVGDSGIFAYTINGSKSWQTVPSNLINTSGMASILNGTNNNLRGIFMPDINSFVISDVSSNFVSGSTLGNSKTIYGFFPNLFNRVNNKVLDVSGNMEITGDILIDGSGQITTTNNDFYLLNSTVQNITMGSSTSVINIGGTSTSNKIPNTLYVAADVSLNSRLFLDGDASINSRVFVNGDVSLNSKLFVDGDVSMNSRLSIDQDVSLNSRLYVTQDGEFASNVNVSGNIVSKSTIYSTYFDSSNSDIYIGAPNTSKNIYIGSQVDNGTNNSTSIYVGNDNDHVYLRGEVFTKTTQNLNVFTKVIQLNDGEMGNNQSALSGLQIRDNSNDLQGFFGISSNMTGFNFNSTQSSNVVRLDCSSLLLNSGVNNGMVILTRSTNNYTGSVIDSSYVISVNNNVDGNYNGTGNFYVGTKSILNGDVSMNSNMAINGVVTMNSDLIIYGNTSLKAALAMNGDVSLNGKLFLSDDASLNYRLFVNGDVSMNSTLCVGSDTSLNSRLYVTGDVSLNSRLIVNETSLFKADVSMNSNLNIPNGGIAIGKPTVTSGYVLDLSGNINHAGVVFQF